MGSNSGGYGLDFLSVFFIVLYMGHFKTFSKYYFPMIFPAAGAAFLPERLAKSARIRVFTMASDRAELTDLCCLRSRSNPLAGARAVAV